jgi:ABC-type multidrug transport system ATPase subunit
MVASQENSTPMVDVKNVTLRFNTVEAVKNVSFHVARGKVLGLVGSDGAGKSTLLRLIATMIKPTLGEIYIDGLSVLSEKQKIKNIIGYMVHEPQVLILDEPTNGVDPVSRHEFWEILGSMQKEGMTILVSTAYLDEGEKCDTVGLMHSSVLLDMASPSVLRGSFKTLEEAIIERIKDADGELANDTFHF